MDAHPPLPLQVVVSTTTSGWTTISCDEVHDGGSSVMVVSDRSDPRSRRGTYVTDGFPVPVLPPALPVESIRTLPGPPAPECIRPERST